MPTDNTNPPGQVDPSEKTFGVDPSERTIDGSAQAMSAEESDANEQERSAQEKDSGSSEGSIIAE